MNRRNTDNVIHDFVRETRDELPERVYAAIRHEIEQSPQRIVLGPWRTPFMNNISRPALAGAALVAVAVVAVLSFTVFGKQGPTIGDGPTSSPAATLAATPTNIPSPSTSADVGVLTASDKGKPIAPGSHTITIPGIATYGFTVGDNWWLTDISSDQVSMHRQRPSSDQWVSSVVLTPVKAVYHDPCYRSGGAVAVDQTVPAILDALTHQVGFPASSPTPAQLDGATGSTFTAMNTFTVDASIDTVANRCTTDGPMLQFQDPLNVDFETASGERETLWVHDLGHGDPLVAVVQTYEISPSAEHGDAEQVVSSMSFR